MIVTSINMPVVTRSKTFGKPRLDYRGAFRVTKIRRTPHEKDIAYYMSRTQDLLTSLRYNIKCLR